MNFVVFDVIATYEFGVFSAATFLQGLKCEHVTSILELPVIQGYRKRWTGFETAIT